MSNQFVHYLNQAAHGQLPGMIILKLMLLEVPNLIGLLLPLGFYMAILIAYGRLYADSEMIVLQACGYGPVHLLKHSLVLAVAVALFVAMLMIWLSPIIATSRATLLRTVGVKTIIQALVPGHFHDLAKGTKVFYVESMNRDHTQAKNIFLARQEIKNNQPQWSILWAKKAFLATDSRSNENYIVLQQGKEYEGMPGHADYQVADFMQYKSKLPHPQVVALNEDIRITKTKDLWPLLNQDNRKAAELQWRLSIPLMVLVLTIVAVPLSKANSRTGKFAKLLPAILIYFLYANFMFMGRNWIAGGKIPQWLGLWWLHIVVALGGGVMLFHNRR